MHMGALMNIWTWHIRTIQHEMDGLDLVSQIPPLIVVLRKPLARFLLSRFATRSPLPTPSHHKSTHARARVRPLAPRLPSASALRRASPELAPCVVPLLNQPPMLAPCVTPAPPPCASTLRLAAGALRRVSPSPTPLPPR